MTQRIDYFSAAPDALKTILALETHVSQQSGLEKRLIHLVKLRASQLNGCAFCVDMHVKESRKDGLSEQWIALVSAWHEATVFDPRERAVLAWTEAVTRIGETRAPDEVYDPLRHYFSESEIVELTVAIATINIWNRLAVAFRTPHPVDRQNHAA